MKSDTKIETIIDVIRKTCMKKKEWITILVTQFRGNCTKKIILRKSNR